MNVINIVRCKGTQTDFMLRKKNDDKSATSNASSQYRGVSFNTHSQKWKAVITVGRKQYFLGYFVNEIEAARAYDKASLELRGPEAPTNFKYDSATLASIAGQANAVQIHNNDDEDMDTEPQCASLEKLLDGQTGDSMESVRDVEMELNAVRTTLLMREQAIMNARAASQMKVKQEDLPSEFMCL